MDEPIKKEEYKKRLVPSRGAIKTTINNAITTVTSVAVVVDKDASVISINSLDAGVFINLNATAVAVDNGFKHYVRAGGRIDVPCFGVQTINLIADEETTRVRILQY